MKIWIALLRGVNVGSTRKLPMKDFATALTKAGLSDVRTYIQSGNVVFRSREATAAPLVKIVETAIEKVGGFKSRAQVLSASDLRKAARDNPFPKATATHTSLHFFFLSEKVATAELAALEPLKTDHEDFALKGRVFYLYSRDGLTASKLAEKAARLLGDRATARNWRTVATLVEMAES
jgi:uncharacterized protein (DUF1697 family)